MVENMKKPTSPNAGTQPRDIELPILRPDLLPPGAKHRDEITPDESICDHCVGKCCRYFTVPLKTPRTRADFDELRWYLAHERTLIFVETDKTGKVPRRKWNLVVWTRCEYLGPDQRCMIYDDRPQVCRDYKSDSCEYDSPWGFEASFETPDSIRAYGEQALAAARQARRRKPVSEAPRS
jgi:Fe-S-cluster containining protein